MADDYDYEAEKRAGVKADATGHHDSRFKKESNARLYLPSALGTYDTKRNKIVPLDTKMNIGQQETMRTEPTMSNEEVSGYLKYGQNDGGGMFEPWKSPGSDGDPYGGV